MLDSENKTYMPCSFSYDFKCRILQIEKPISNKDMFCDFCYNHGTILWISSDFWLYLFSLHFYIHISCLKFGLKAIGHKWFIYVYKFKHWLYFILPLI